MGNVTVEDIIVTPQKIISMEAGNVMHAMKINDIGFAGFGEAYFSILKFGSVKAWKKHNNMTLNIIVPIGDIQFVFIDQNENIKEIFIGLSNYSRLTIPPGIWFGMRGLYQPTSLLMNIANINHDPFEIERKSLDEFKYVWGTLK
jgi:dTDP-4-dehydrorhamnose 3,5-epimerase